MNSCKGKATEIDLIDLMRTIGHRWRSIIVCMIAFAMLFGGYGIYSNIAANRSIEAKPIIIEEDSEFEVVKGATKNDIEEYANNLEMTDKEKRDLRMALFEYSILQDYSLSLMNLNTDMEPLSQSDSRYLQYRIHVVEEGNAAETAYSIAFTLDRFIRFGGLSASVGQTGYADPYGYDLQKLISDDYYIYPRNDDTRDDEIEVPFLVICKGVDADRLAEAVKAVLTSWIANYQSDASVSLKLVEQYSSPETNSYLTDYIYFLSENYIEHYKRVLNYSNAFSEEQCILFNEIVGENIFDVPDKNNASTPIVVRKPVGLTSGLVKKVIIGLFCGLALPCVWLFVLYLINGTIKTKEDLDNYFGLFYLGDVTRENSKKRWGRGIDRAIDRLFGIKAVLPEEREKMLIANIKSICRIQNINKLALVSSLDLEAAAIEQLDRVVEFLSREGIEAKYERSVLNNSQDFEALLDCGNAIMVERLAKSKIVELERYAQVFEKHGINVVGAAGI